MNLAFDTTLTKGYSSQSQIVRVLTENWVEHNAYCPNCCLSLKPFKNNAPVADFYCAQCREEFELKSKKGFKLGKKITDGAYDTMIERIHSDKNPHFFFLTYDKVNWSVHNFLIIPKQYFVRHIIEKRKPLAKRARRSGWVGCNINLTQIPLAGRIFFVKQGKLISPEIISKKWQQSAFLKAQKTDRKSWLLNVMHCIDSIKTEIFTLDEVYQFEALLQTKYPENRFIKAKIRQQLQILRDNGIITFEKRGVYKKVNP